MTKRFGLAWLGKCVFWGAPRRSEAETGYDEAVSALIALKSLFEAELARRGAPSASGLKLRDADEK